MADRWMDERDRMWRDRDWRRSQEYGRGERDERRFVGGEDRSWRGASDEERPYAARRSGPDRDRVFGERETGLSYGGEDYEAQGGVEYGGRYGGTRGGVAYGGEGYRTGGRTSAYRSEGERYGARGYGGDWRSGTWQDRDYGGVSPAMEHGEYDLERRAERFEREHGYGMRQGEGGRYYGDAGREPIYREEWSQGRRDYGAAPRGYDVESDVDGRRGRFEEGYDTRRFATGGMASGGTGGYDYERGYGDGGRQRYTEGRFGLPRDEDRDRDWRRREEDRGERWERRGHDAGDWFRRTGERVASWFGGGDERRREDEERSFRRDYGRDRGYRGLGPKGYQRSDDRISDEAHERLTDDPWLDASNIAISVSGGEVTLSGTVENREAKHRAERVVEDISGAKHVQNNLRVEANPLTSPARGYGDSVLQEQMRQAETRTPSTGASDVGTSTGASTRTGGSTSTDAGKSR